MHRRGVMMVGAASLLWGTLGIGANLLFKDGLVSPTLLSFLRMAVAAPCLAGVAFALSPQAFRSYTRADLVVVGSIGVLLALSQTLYFAAIPLAGVGVSTVVAICLAPVAVVAISLLLGTDRLTGSGATALIMAVSGASLLSFGPSVVSVERSALQGGLLSLGSALSYAGVVIMIGRLSTAQSPVEVMAAAFAFGALCLLPLAWQDCVDTPLCFQTWLVVLYLGLVPTSFAYAIFALGVRYVKPITASILSMIDPLTAAVLAWAVFGEAMDLRGAAGTLLLMSAVVMLYRRPPRAADLHT